MKTMPYYFFFLLKININVLQREEKRDGLLQIEDNRDVL
uniref:Uncharacterized protein n=1 Tax=Nelumbo nucifera TaxID=4432 RepID=A0A822Z4L0_NELNU|nr:TPA_asm: hypothetical protein HUJ06_007109 [Nelumbo nucifera]